MSREELKYAVRREADLRQRIETFCLDRWEELRGLKSGDIEHLAKGQGACQLVVFPLFDGSFDFRFDVPTIKGRIPVYSAFHQRDSASARATIDGLEYRMSKLRDGKLQGYAKLFRHGAIQIADGYTMDFRERETGLAPHPGGLLMSGLLRSIEKAIETSHSVTGADTFVVEFRVMTKAGHRIAFFNDSFGYGSGSADRDELIFDPLILVAAENWKSDLPNLCKPLLDQVWQAFGFDQCDYFDQSGKYTHPNV